MPKTLHWSDGGAFDGEIVGESNYQKDLKRLAGGERRKQTTARLVCESNNPYDKQAVKVEIGGKTVGHLSREDARAHRRKLESMKAASAIVETPAVIVTGSEGVCGVYLDLPEEDDDEPGPAARAAAPARQKPFVQRYFVLLSVAAAIMLLSGVLSPIGLVLAVFLVYYRSKRWQP